MTLFNSDFEALIVIVIVGLCIFVINKIVSAVFDKSTKIPAKQKIMINFILKILSLLILVFLIIEGFPSFGTIDPKYTAVLTGAISTAIAFASSGVFANLISGIVLMVVRPFDVGDLVKIKNTKGVIRTIGLTKALLETFDNVYVELSNSDILSSIIVNYTVKIGKKRSLETFKKQLQAPQDEGFVEIPGDCQYCEEDYEKEITEVYNKLLTKTYPNLFVFTFRMTFPHKKLRVILDKVEQLCKEYQEKGIFLIKPKYDIIDFALRVTLKFRILTFNVDKIFMYQPIFAGEIFNIIHETN